MSSQNKYRKSPEYTPAVKARRRFYHKIRQLAAEYNPEFKKKHFKVRFVNRLYDKPLKKVVKKID